MNINIQRGVLVKELEDRVMAKVINQLPGMENKAPNEAINRIVMKDLGFGLENITTDNEVGLVLSKLRSSLEDRVERFAIKRVTVPAIEGLSDEECMVRGIYAFEEEEEKEEDGEGSEPDDDGDVDPFAGDPDNDSEPEDTPEEKMVKTETGIATIVADLIKTVVTADAEEVNDIAEKIITLSKDEAEINRETEEGEEDIFATSDPDEEGKDGDDPENDDPFADEEGGDSSNGDDDEEGKKNSKKDDKEGDGGEKDNPFEDEEGGNEDSDPEDGDGGKDNPFDDDDGGDDDNPSPKERGEENAKAKCISDLKLSTFGLEKLNYGYEEFQPFRDLKNDSFNNYAKFLADGVYSEEMHTAYTNHGMESEEFVAIKSKYAKLAKDIHGASIGVTLLSGLIGNESINKAKLLSPETFNV